MRVSSNQMSQNYLRQLNKVYNEQMKWNEKMDGSNIHRPSDDPVQCVRTMTYTASLTQNEQYTQNLNDANSWMKATDTSMVQMSDILKTISEKTSQAANSYLGQDDLNAIAKEVDELINEMLSLSNGQLGDRYIFAGQADKTKPYGDSFVVKDKADLKVLDGDQAKVFGTEQLFVLNDQNSDAKYYLDLSTGNIYDQDYVDKGYKDKGKEAGKVGSIGSLGDVKDNFVMASEDPEKAGTVKGGPLADLISITTADGDALDLKLSTSDQTVVRYYGDTNKISMPVQNGGAVPDSDSVNVNGEDLFGTDIFGNVGSELINNLYSIRDHMRSGDVKWLSGDGMQRAEDANNHMLNAETEIGSRMQAYTMLENMMNNNNTVIQKDITDASAAKVDEVITQMRMSDVIYRMSLSVAGKILPPSLVDYI